MGYMRFSVIEDDGRPHIFDLVVLKLFDLGTLYILKNDWESQITFVYVGCTYNLVTIL